MADNSTKDKAITATTVSSFAPSLSALTNAICKLKSHYVQYQFELIKNAANEDRQLYVFVDMEYTTVHHNCKGPIRKQFFEIAKNLKEAGGKIIAFECDAMREYTEEEKNCFTKIYIQKITHGGYIELAWGSRKHHIIKKILKNAPLSRRFMYFSNNFVYEFDEYTESGDVLINLCDESTLFNNYVTDKEILENIFFFLTMQLLMRCDEPFEPTKLAIQKFRVECAIKRNVKRKLEEKIKLRNSHINLPTQIWTGKKWIYNCGYAKKGGKANEEEQKQEEDKKDEDEGKEDEEKDETEETEEEEKDEEDILSV